MYIATSGPDVRTVDRFNIDKLTKEIYKYFNVDKVEIVFEQSVAWVELKLWRWISGSNICFKAFISFDSLECEYPDHLTLQDTRFITELLEDIIDRAKEP